jgi:hypothetical protein
MDPEGLEAVVLEVGVLAIQGGEPAAERGEDLLAGATLELDAGSLANIVLWLLEQVEEDGDGLTGDGLGLEQGT